MITPFELRQAIGTALSMTVEQIGYIDIADAMDSDHQEQVVLVLTYHLYPLIFPPTVAQK